MARTDGEDSPLSDQDWAGGGRTPALCPVGFLLQDLGYQQETATTLILFASAHRCMTTRSKDGGWGLLASLTTPTPALSGAGGCRYPPICILSII